MNLNKIKYFLRTMNQAVQQPLKGKNSKQEIQVDQSYEEKFYNLKINRLNKGDNSMVPIPGVIIMNK